METLTLLEETLDEIKVRQQSEVEASQNECDSDCDTESDHSCDCYTGNG